MNPILFILGLAAAWYFGWFDFLKSYTYRAEVGYYSEGQRTWYVGSDKSKDECISEATSRFNSLNAEHSGRAFSWACRKMDGEQFLDRVR